MKYTELDDCEEFYHKVEYYNKTKTEQLSYHYKEILKLLGEDPDREGLVKTPYRVAKAMQFMTRGYHENPEEILRSALFKEDYRQMVIVKNIEIYSMCEHHMLPFIGQAHVAYIPNGYITGLSKIARDSGSFFQKTASTGKIDKRHKELHPEHPQPPGRCRGDRSTAHVYDDAGRSKTKLGNNDFRLQRRIRETRHAGGIHPADQ